jgi:hypothetical protein
MPRFGASDDDVWSFGQWAGRTMLDQCMDALGGVLRRSSVVCAVGLVKRKKAALRRKSTLMMHALATVGGSPQVPAEWRDDDADGHALLSTVRAGAYAAPALRLVVCTFVALDVKGAV